MYHLPVHISTIISQMVEDGKEKSEGERVSLMGVLSDYSSF